MFFPKLLGTGDFYLDLLEVRHMDLEVMVTKHI